MLQPKVWIGLLLADFEATVPSPGLVASFIQPLSYSMSGTGTSGLPRQHGRARFKELASLITDHRVTRAQGCNGAISRAARPRNQRKLEPTLKHICLAQV